MVAYAPISGSQFHSFFRAGEIEPDDRDVPAVVSFEHKDLLLVVRNQGFVSSCSSDYSSGSRRRCRRGPDSQSSIRACRCRGCPPGSAERSRRYRDTFV